MTALLELRGVSVDFPIRSLVLRRRIGRVRAVDGVDLRLDRGETLGLVGESGSGKTTTGRVALGLQEPTDGSVFVEDTDVSHLRKDDRKAMRRRLQFVFQDPYSSLDPLSPVADAIAEPLRTHHLGDRAARRARVSELLELVGLRPDVANRYPREFSGGQLQRIAIARALALDPQLIVLDEPVSSLDVSTQASVVNLLARLQAELGVAYLFIAHDLAVVDHVSSHIAVMYLGQVVEQGTSEAVVSRPKHPYTLALLSAVPGRGATEREKRPQIVLRGDLPSLTVTVPGCRFHTRCPFAMDVCRHVAPPPYMAPDGSVATCHLHTEGPALAGETVANLPLPDQARIGRASRPASASGPRGAPIPTKRAGADR